MSNITNNATKRPSILDILLSFFYFQLKSLMDFRAFKDGHYFMSSSFDRERWDLSGAQKQAGFLRLKLFK